MKVSRLATLLSLFFLSAVAQPARAQDVVRMAGVFSVSSALPYYVALENGYFAAQNLSVKSVNVQSSA